MQRGRDDGAERGVPRGGGGVEKARGKGLEESVTGRAGPLQRAINNLYHASIVFSCILYM